MLCCMTFEYLRPPSVLPRLSKTPRLVFDNAKDKCNLFQLKRHLGFQRKPYVKIESSLTHLATQSSSGFKTLLFQGFHLRRKRASLKTLSKNCSSVTKTKKGSWSSSVASTQTKNDKHADFARTRKQRWNKPLHYRKASYGTAKELTWPSLFLVVTWAYKYWLLDYMPETHFTEC